MVRRSLPPVRPHGAPPNARPPRAAPPGLPSRKGPDQRFEDPPTNGMCCGLLEACPPGCSSSRGILHRSSAPACPLPRRFATGSAPIPQLPKQNELNGPAPPPWAPSPSGCLPARRVSHRRAFPRPASPTRPGRRDTTSICQLIVYIYRADRARVKKLLPRCAGCPSRELRPPCRLRTCAVAVDPRHRPYDPAV